MISLSLKCKSNLFLKRSSFFLYHKHHRHVLSDNGLMIHSHHILLRYKVLLDLYLTIRLYYNNMKSSNKFVVVFVDLMVKDDGYIHSSTAVAAADVTGAVVVVEVDTTFIYIYIYVCVYFFFFSKNFKSVV